MIALFFAVVTTVVLWASAFVAIRIAVTGYPPAALALLRFFVASAVLGAWALKARPGLPRRRDLPGIALAALTGVTGYHVALNFGEQRVSAGAASLLVSTAPLFATLLAILFLGERVSLRGWLGLVVGFTGAAFTAGATAGGMQFTPAAGAVVAATLLLGAYYVLQKPLLPTYGAVALTTYVVWAGTIGLLPALPSLLQALPNASAAATWAVVYLGIFPGAIAYATWSYVHHRLPTSQAVVCLYLVSPFTVVIGLVLLDERPNLRMLAGGALALAGVALVQLRRPAPPLEGGRPKAAPLDHKMPWRAIAKGITIKGWL